MDMDDEWQSIETKPRDHLLVLIYGPFGCRVAFWDVTWRWWTPDGEEPLDYTPTHWMPLPERPKDYADVPLQELLRKARKVVDAMTPEERAEMLRKQGEGWAKSEAQWAKDFREGKCNFD
jgi:hypothetical protein